LCDVLLNQAHVAVLPGSDFYLAATELGIRVAGVDYDGAAALQAWPSENQVSEELAGRLFPRLIGGCDRLEEFLSGL
jgi:hypothetical protein